MPIARAQAASGAVSGLEQSGVKRSVTLVGRGTPARSSTTSKSPACKWLCDKWFSISNHPQSLPPPLRHSLCGREAEMISKEAAAAVGVAAENDDAGRENRRGSSRIRGGRDHRADRLGPITFRAAIGQASVGAGERLAGTGLAAGRVRRQSRSCVAIRACRARKGERATGLSPRDGGGGGGGAPAHGLPRRAVGGHCGICVK